MLARSGPLPLRAGSVFEPKWDGVRCLARTGTDMQIRSRRGWNMTELVPELTGMPAGVYDGELVAIRDGEPYFPDVYSRPLTLRPSVGSVWTLTALATE